MLSNKGSQNSLLIFALKDLMFVFCCRIGSMCRRKDGEGQWGHSFQLHPLGGVFQSRIDAEVENRVERARFGRSARAQRYRQCVLCVTHKRGFCASFLALSDLRLPLLWKIRHSQKAAGKKTEEVFFATRMSPFFNRMSLF